MSSDFARNERFFPFSWLSLEWAFVNWLTVHFDKVCRSLEGHCNLVDFAIFAAKLLRIALVNWNDAWNRRQNISPISVQFSIEPIDSVVTGRVGSQSTPIVSGLRI